MSNVYLDVVINSHVQIKEHQDCNPVGCGIWRQVKLKINCDLIPGIIS